MEMEKNSTLKYGIWLTGASMMFVSAWFCVRLTGTVGEMGRYLDSMDSVVCMEELLDYEKEENGRALEENDLAELRKGGYITVHRGVLEKITRTLPAHF